MIITKTPFRMSFFGGGTDMPAFFNEHGGAVINTTFDKYCYVNVRHIPPFHPYISELVHNRFERVNNFKYSFRAVLYTLIYICFFVPKSNFGQNDHKRRRQVLCLNGSQVPKLVQEKEASRVL